MTVIQWLYQFLRDVAKKIQVLANLGLLRLIRGAIFDPLPSRFSCQAAMVGVPRVVAEDDKGARPSSS